MPRMDGRPSTSPVIGVLPLACYCLGLWRLGWALDRKMPGFIFARRAEL